jgi:periplasmic protein TonB
MAFETFLRESRQRPGGGRVVALVASGLGHTAVVLGLAALLLQPSARTALPVLVPVSLMPFPSRPAPAAPVAEPARSPEPPRADSAVAAPRAPKRRPRPALAPARPRDPPAPTAAAVPESPAQPPEAPAPAAPPEPPAAGMPSGSVSPGVTAPATPSAGGPPAPTAPRRPRFLPEGLGAAQKLAGDLPRLPPALARSGTSYTVLARVCVAESGQVSSVSIERAGHPALDPQVAATLATWRYRPLLAANLPIPFCTFVRFEFRSL